MSPERWMNIAQIKNNGRMSVEATQNLLILPEGTFSSSYSYDALNRIASYTENSSGQSLTSTYQYDLFSNVSKAIYPGGFSVSNEYTTTGFLHIIKNDLTNDVIWHGTELNSAGQFTKYFLGPNNVETQTTYNSFGFPEKIFSAGIQDLNMEFEIKNGNLKWRQDDFGHRNLKEEFSYDNLNRLKTAQITSPNPLQSNFVQYNLTDGRIDQKSDAGISQDYWSNHPDALKNLTIPSINISHSPQDIIYTPFNKTKSITEGDESINIFYSPDQERRKTEFFHLGNLTSRRFYYPGYEKETTGANTTEIYYINAPTGICAMYVVEAGVGKMYYVYKDHLGSILKVTDGLGNIYEQNFDAWGRSRNPADWTYSGIPIVPAWLYRGFTGHEHLPQFVLINMNGRMYDPVLGMMLSPDNYVPDATSTKGFNRYCYVLDNPLSYIDKDGNMPFLIVAFMIAGAYAGGVATNSGQLNPLQWNYSNPATYFGIVTGAAIGYLGGYGLLNPAAFSWQISIGVPGAAVTLGGNSSNWNFQWSTSAGGGGQIASSGGGGGPSINWSDVNNARDEERKEYYTFKISQQQDNDMLAMTGGDEIGVFHNRPDADGYITYEESAQWYREGNGQPLYANLDYLNLSGISASDFKNGEGGSQPFNLASNKYFRSIDQALVYGSITLTLQKGNMVTATFGYDKYNFDIKSWSKETYVRNVETITGHLWVGPGTPYYIYFYGYGRISH